ncbi:MAG: hypothetical protein KF761_05680 [Salinibacterium sp.]|nr:hypothetical protein [Salinibacterium sp.]
MRDYVDLGIRTVVNAGGAQSRLGGSTLSPEVREAMSRASTEYVDVEALHDRVGQRLAVATRNEAAAVSAGSAAGIMIAVAAVITGTDPDRAAALPRQGDSRPTVAVWRAHTTGVLAGADSIHDNGYLNSIAAGGGWVRVIDAPAELRSSDAALVWFPGMYGIPDEDTKLIEFAAQARDVGVPVIVDAADQIPPFARSWEYTTAWGADLALFSGGKGLHGPTSSGLILGRADLVAACRANSGTEHGVGRPAKIGREELLGLLVAVEHASRVDEDARFAEQDAVVQHWAEAFASLPIDLERVPLGHCGQRIPRLILRLRSGSRECRDDLIAELWDADPRVAVLPEVEAAIALSPQLLVDDQPSLVEALVHRVISAHLEGCPVCAPD